MPTLKASERVNHLLGGKHMRHFLIVASSSRGGRFFIKKALQSGHNITALCRAPSHEKAEERMGDLLEQTHLTPGGPDPSGTPGIFKARNYNILDPETYTTLLKEDPSIDGIISFVGPTRLKQMMSRTCTLYTDTIQAILEGMKKSRSVEVLYHSSVGTEGAPYDAVVGWPKPYPFLAGLVPFFLPVFKNVTLSERLLARSDLNDLKFIVFRPATLTDAKAERHFGYSIDNSSDNQPTLPLKEAKTSIAREDVAEEILRVGTMPEAERAAFYGHALYLADLKSSKR